MGQESLFPPMRAPRLTTLLITSLLVVSIIPAPAGAQSSTQSLLLNEDSTQLETVTLQDEQYEIFHYENTLSYASGIAIYHDGDTVTSPERANTILTALAQQQAVQHLDADTLEILRKIREEATIIASASEAAYRSLNETTAYNARLKTVDVDGTTAWNASTTAAPRLASLNATATELKPPLRATERYARDVVANTSDLILLLEQRQNETAVDPQRLYDQYQTTLKALEKLSGQSYEIDNLAALGNSSTRIAANVSTVPERGGAIADYYERSGSHISQNASRIRLAFKILDSEMGWEAPILAARNRAESGQSALIDQWRERRFAARDVYGTIGIPVVLLGALGYLRYGS